MSDTPRTESEIYIVSCVPADFARTLEREVAALKAERDAAVEKIEAHCLSTSWQRDDILYRVARERGWYEGKLVENLNRILTEHDELRAEVERLRALLRECGLFLDPAYDGDNFDVPEIRKRIRAALEEK